MPQHDFLDDYSDYLQNLCFTSDIKGVNEYFINVINAESTIMLIGSARKLIEKYVPIPCPPKDRERYIMDFYDKHLYRMSSIPLSSLCRLIYLLSSCSSEVVSLLPRKNRFSMCKYRILLILLVAKSYVRPKQLMKFVCDPEFYRRYKAWWYSRRSLFRNLENLVQQGLINRYTPCHKKTGYYLSEKGYKIANLLYHLAEFKGSLYYFLYRSF